MKKLIQSRTAALESSLDADGDQEEEDGGIHLLPTSDPRLLIDILAAASQKMMQVRRETLFFWSPRFEVY